MYISKCVKVRKHSNVRFRELRLENAQSKIKRLVFYAYGARMDLHIYGVMGSTIHECARLKNIYIYIAVVASNEPNSL